MSAALITGAAVSFILGRQLLGALSASSGKLTAQKRATTAAEREAAEAKKRAKDLAKQLRADAERMERAEKPKPGKPPVKPHSVKPQAPPAPPEPPLYDVQLGDAVIHHKPPAATLEDAGKQAPTKRQWAEELYTYALREIREGRADGLGHRGQPNARVKAAQQGMGKLVNDGIYGDKTMARGKELTGKSFPKRNQPKAPAPTTATPGPDFRDFPVIPGLMSGPAKPKPKPAQEKPKPTPVKPATAPAAIRSPVKAAQDLLKYARGLISDGHASQLGNASNPNPYVQAAQRDMGGIKDDGVYGPATRQRGKALTGETFPARG
jgi:hypothetical protein